MAKAFSPANTTTLRQKELGPESGRFNFVLALLVLVLAIGCTRNEEEIAEKTGDTIGTVTVEEIAGSSDQYVGKSVFISGEITRFYQPGVFALSDKAEPKGEILVVTREPLPMPKELPGAPPEAMDHTVQVAGTIKRFVATEVEQALGFHLKPEIQADLKENQPVLFAQSITQTPNIGLGGSGTLDGQERGTANRDLGPP